MKILSHPGHGNSMCYSVYSIYSIIGSWTYFVCLSHPRGFHSSNWRGAAGFKTLCGSVLTEFIRWFELISIWHNFINFIAFENQHLVFNIQFLNLKVESSDFFYSLISQILICLKSFTTLSKQYVTPSVLTHLIQLRKTPKTASNTL